MQQLVGTTLGRYRIDGVLGRGGMAWVYRALDPAFGRTVAIKILAPKIASEPQYVERFLREARSMARLQHPHIMPVYDVGEQNGTAYLVMPYVDGGSLHERLAATRQGNRMSLRELLAIMRPVAHALDYAHHLGFIHRDIKPQNILLTSQQHAFLTDFGIAKVADVDLAGHSLTNADTIIGTPDYMSPEQGQGLPLDGRADLYSFGVILYEVFTGRTPFRANSPAETPLAIMMRHVTTPPPAPRSINPQLPPALEAVLLRALAKQPDDRYPTGAALMDALEAAVETVRLPQAQGGMAAQSLSDFRLPAAPTPLPQRVGTPPGTGRVTDVTSTSATVATGTGPVRAPVDAGPIPSHPGGTTPPPSLPLSVTAAEPPAPRQRRVLPILLAGGVIALLLLVGIAALRVATASSGGGGATATSTIAGSAVPGLAQITVTATVTPTAVGQASSAASASSGQTPTVPFSSVLPAGSGTPVPSIAPGGATPGGGGTPGATTKREVILFSSHRNGVHESQIYTMNPDGSGQRILVNTKGHSWGPRVSRDGKFLVFSTVIGDHNNHTATGGGEQGVGHHEIFRARTDGSDIQQITNTDATIWNNAWAWSPDGKSLLFTSDRDGNWEIYRMAVDGTGVTRLTNNPAQDGWPAWTPDGKSIIFASDRDFKVSQIYIMDADGQNPRRLIASESYDTLPSISPDGKSVVYSAQSGEIGEIYTMDLAGGTPTRLTSTVAMNTEPSFSPDGSKIVFTSDRGGNTDVYVMDRDGKNVKQITTDPGEDVTPYWAVIEVAAIIPGGDPLANANSSGDFQAIVPRREECAAA